MIVNKKLFCYFAAYLYQILSPVLEFKSVALSAYILAKHRNILAKRRILRH